MNGWRLTGVLSLLLALMCALALAIEGWSVEGVRLAVRLTARTSLALFLLAFTASALARLAPSGPTRWLRRNRRYVGVSFAVSHAFHLAALIVLASQAPEVFWSLTNIGNIAFAGVAYVFIAAMAATSFDAAQRWLGLRRWQQLHIVGSWYICLVSLGSLGKRAVVDPFYWPMLALVLVAVALRLVTAFAPRPVAP
jgi:DMSO/TMAO reductase YedYZ heme-binding membrane subunit